MTRRDLQIFATGSPYAWDVLESARRAGFDVICVDNHGGADPRLPGLVAEPIDAPFVIGLSSAEHRGPAALAAYAAGLERPITVVDPSAVVASTVRISHGAYVNAGVVVASNTEIGCHANVNRSASVGHDNVIGFGASLGPGALTTGEVAIEAGAFVGAGAIILPGIRIGADAIVGAGAVVTRDVSPGATVVGNPARPIAQREVRGLRCPHC